MCNKNFARNFCYRAKLLCKSLLVSGRVSLRSAELREEQEGLELSLSFSFLFFSSFFFWLFIVRYTYFSPGHCFTQHHANPEPEPARKEAAAMPQSRSQNPRHAKPEPKLRGDGDIPYAA